MTSIVFQRLGFEVNKGYSLDTILKIVSSEEFQTQHRASSISEADIDIVNEAIKQQARRYVGPVSRFTPNYLGYTRLQFQY